MPKWFNTAGPCKADIHYMLPPLARLPELESLIEQQGYFVIHAPRQTGKTTSMMALAAQLTASGRYTAIVLSVETGAPFKHDPTQAHKYILNNWWNTLRVTLPPELQLLNRLSVQQEAGTTDLDLQTVLQIWTLASPRPLVVFLDEIDSLEEETLISVLRQLRAGYPHRPQGFPHSLALIGVRDVRDYKVASGGSPRLGTASPFNIKIRSFTLGNFTPAEVKALYAQHTEATGQIFTPEVLDAVFSLSQGQPWLVNSLAKVMVEELVCDRQLTITSEHLGQAKEILIQRRETHLDSLVSMLQEPKVKAVFEPMLAGQEPETVQDEDRQFLVDLGLLRRESGGGFVVANRIYQEIIPRVLAGGPQDSLPRISPTWLKPDGTLDPDKLLESFLTFWRQHGEPLLKSAPYHEIAPHLVMMAFLHRVVNGGGTLEREYAIGSRRMDLCLRYGAVTLGMELKVWRDSRPDPLQKGLEQLDHYLAGLGLNQGWLVIFDQRSGLPPIEERTTTEQAITPEGRSTIVIRG